MADELTLTAEADLLPVLQRVQDRVERAANETPEQRSVRLEIGGVTRNVGSLSSVANVFVSLLDEDNRADFSQRYDQLVAGLDPVSRSKLADARYAFDRSGDLDTMKKDVAARLEQVRGDIASDQQHLNRLESRKQAALATGVTQLAPLKGALAELRDATSPSELKRIREAHASAQSELDRMQSAFAKMQPDEQLTWRGLVAHLEQVAAETNPNVVLAAKMQGVVDKLPLYSDERRLLGGLTDELKIANLDRSAQHRINKLTNALPELERASGSITRTISVGVGVETSAVLTKASLKGGYSFSVEMQRLPNGQYRAKVNNAVAVKGEGKVGDEKVAQAKINAAISAGLGEWRTYNSLEDLAVAEGAYLMDVTLGPRHGDARSSRHFLKARRALLQKVVANRDNLAEDLTRINAFDDLPADRKTLPLATHKLEHIERIRTTVREGAGKIGASGTIHEWDKVDGKAGKGAFSASGELKVSVTRKQDFKSLSYLDELKGPGVLGIEMMKAGAGFVTSVDGELVPHSRTKKHYQDMHRRLDLLNDSVIDGRKDEDVVAEAEQMQGMVKSQLERLSAEYDLFVTLRNRHTAPGDSSQTDDLYRQVLKDRGITGSHKAARYIKAVSLQYAVLRELYDTTAKIAPDREGAFATSADDFAQKLKVPAIELSEKQRRRAFGDEASTDPSYVTSTTATISGSYGGGAEAGPFAGLGGSLSASVTGSRTKKKGKITSSVIKMSVDFSLDDLKGKASTDPKIDDALAGALAAKLLDRQLMRKLYPGANQGGHESAVAELKQSFLALGASAMAAGRLDIRFDNVDGGWRLRTVAAVEKSTTGLSAGGSIPVGMGLSVAIDASVEQSKSRVVRVHHGARTLSGLTDTLRLRSRAGSVVDAEWSRFKDESQLLTRMMESLALNGRGGSTASGDDIAAVLTKIKAGQIDIDDPASWKMTAGGVANELVPWLASLKKAGGAGADAADDFIDGYVRHADVLQRPNGGKAHDDAVNELAGAFDKVIQAKRVVEDDEKDSGFVHRGRLSRTQLNRQIAERLANSFSELDLRVDAKLSTDRSARSEPADLTSPDSLSRMKRRLLAAHKADPADEETLRLVRDVMSLEHAVETLDDLTRFDNDADKEVALGVLAERSKNVFSDQRVYISPLIEGRLEADGSGQLSVVPIVDRKKAALINKSQIDRDLRNARDRQTKDREDDDEPRLRFKQNVKVETDPDDRTKTSDWSSSYEDKDARDAYWRKRRDVARLPTKSVAKRRKKKRKDKSISAMLEQVLQAQAERQERRRRLARQRRAEQRDAELARA